MKRALLCVISLLALGLIAPACSTIGDPGGMPDGLPHGGTGAFRLLDNEETGISGSPGAAMFLFEPAFENAMVQGDFVFFTAAPPLDEPPMPPEDFPRNEIYWEAFQPRRIQRGVRREEGFAAFDPADEVLTASEPWEGEEIFDPWVVEDGGTFRMYYAGDGGIGVAEASALDGAFTRVAGPVLGPDDAASGSPRRPCAAPRATGSCTTTRAARSAWPAPPTEWRSARPARSPSRVTIWASRPRSRRETPAPSP